MPFIRDSLHLISEEIFPHINGPNVALPVYGRPSPQTKSGRETPVSSVLWFPRNVSESLLLVVINTVTYIISGVMIGK